MPIENKQMHMQHTRAGRPDYMLLDRIGKMPKITHPKGTTFDTHPNPTENIQGHVVSRGMTLAADNIWRVNMSAEKYHDMYLQSEYQREIGKDWNFLPELQNQELDDYRKWLAKKEKVSVENVMIKRGRPLITKNK